ncbi:MAG TPA: tetratricopeptide repeat protein [Polyangiaceae bacterium]
MRRPLLLAAAIAATLVLVAGTGSAQDDARERSRAAFRRGVSQAESGDYTSARDSFLEAYKLFPHPSILLNLGIARAHTGQWLEAEQDLVHFLADDGGARPDELASARAELAQTRLHLGSFRLRAAPDGARATLDARPLALMPGSFVDVRTTRGTHALRVDADGYTPYSKKLEVVGEKAPDVDVSLQPIGQAPPPQHPGEGRRIAGWFLVAGAGVAAVVGTVAGFEAMSLANEYNNPTDTQHFQDQGTKASGITFRTSADIAFLGALALGGAGAYLLLTAPDAQAAQARLVVGPWSGIAGSF